MQYGNKDDPWYGLLVDATVDTETGSFTVTDPDFGFYLWGNLDSSPSRVNRTDSGTGTIEATFSNGGSNDDLPSIIKGEVEVTGFRRKAANSDNYESAETGGKINSLTGRFSSDLVSDVKVRKLEGNIGPFSYGLWAIDRPEDNRASLSIPRGEVLYPPADVSVDYPIEVTYQKEDGFRGIYVYKDQTGVITSDVDLILTFWADYNNNVHEVSARGFIASPFEMAGDSFQGISTLGVTVEPDNGSITYSSMRFGSIDTKQSLQDHGTYELNLGFTKGNPEGSISLEKYPDHVGGELKITGFSLDETENYSDNSLVGVFVGDKESAVNPNTGEEIK